MKIVTAKAIHICNYSQIVYFRKVFVNVSHFARAMA